MNRRNVDSFTVTRQSYRPARWRYNDTAALGAAPFVRVEEAKMSVAVKGPVAVEDVNVTFDDQQKINKFARNTSRMTELKSEIEAKKKSLQNLQDASDDLMMLDDDSLLIPYQIGDVFVSHTQEETQEMLETAKEYPTSKLDSVDLLNNMLLKWETEIVCQKCSCLVFIHIWNFLLRHCRTCSCTRTLLLDCCFFFTN
ncbi:Prefoldin subunit 4 [Scophthalmus maximus]|uniref:Prefoldin subunit 4 n=1 Tax=Scophthalmus maximus TaxID=52904 RepID=A0A2U9C0S8_SCOMX|nr:Prefoldin subunit 4 [Scophthalmus maximus]